MLITSLIGVACNILMGLTLHQSVPHDHGLTECSHGHGHGHKHGEHDHCAIDLHEHKESTTRASLKDEEVPEATPGIEDQEETSLEIDVELNHSQMSADTKSSPKKLIKRKNQEPKDYVANKSKPRTY